MEERLLALGGNGYTASRVCALARDAGWPVTIASREQPPEQQWVAWDAMAECTFQEALGEQTTVLYTVPTLYREVFDDGRHVAPVERALDACDAAGHRSFIYLSSTAVYGDHDGAWVDEESERRPTSPFGIMRRDIEDLVLARGGYVVRIVGIYGPGRTLVEAFSRGRYKLVDGGETVSNRIHVDDLAQIVWQIARTQPQRRVFLATDGHPMKVKALVEWLRDHVGVEPPASVPIAEYEAERGKNNADRWRNQIRCRNTRVVEELGVSLKYPDVLAGYAAIFADR